MLLLLLIRYCVADVGETQGLLLVNCDSLLAACWLCLAVRHQTGAKHYSLDVTTKSCCLQMQHWVREELLI